LQIIEKGLAERDKSGIGLKWPLQKVTVFIKGGENIKGLGEIIKSQLNVKEIELKSPASKETELVVELDTTLTEELESEGYARNISRQVQSVRKKLGLIKDNHIELVITCDNELVLWLDEYRNFLKDRTNSKKVEILESFSGKGFTEDKFKVKDKEIKVYIKKV